LSNSLKQRILDDMKAALRARDTRKLGAVRLIVAAIKQKEIDERIEASDADVLGVLDKMTKQRKEAIAQFETAKRVDLVEAEKFELCVLESYLPPQLSEPEILAEVERAVAESDATQPKDMGRVMAHLKSRLSGRADMSEVSRLVKAKLQP
jgi:uncharacterized protein